jgi:hypothetical protein
MSESKLVKVAVSIPTMGYTDPMAYCNRLVNFMHLGKLEERGRLLNEPVRFEFYFAVMGRIFTPVARDEAVNLAIDNDCDYLYMIDDDMMCPDDMFEQLYKHDVDIVAPLAFTRNPPHKPVLYHCVEGYDSVAKKEYFINNVIMNYPKDKLVECDAVGFGAVLIKKWVLQKIGKKPFMSTCGTGEDILFCYKARKLGAKIYMDTACKLGHIGTPINITEDYVEGYREHSGYNKEKYYDYSTKGTDKAVYVAG